jgi:chromosome segregation ATPase
LGLQNETMAAQNEKMAETLKQNNVEFDSKQFEAKAGGGSADSAKQSLIEAYKAKLTKAQRELDAKIREMQEKDQRYQALKDQVERNDRILKKHMDENQQLKRQLAAGGSRGPASSPLPKAGGDAAPAKRDFKTMRAQRKEQAQKQIADFN